MIRRWLGLGGRASPYLLTFLVFAVYFGAILRLDIYTDIQFHIQFAYDYVNGHEPLYPNFFFYVLIIALSGFSKELRPYQVSAVLLLAAAVALKLFLTKTYLQKWAAGARPELVWYFALSLLVVFSLPSYAFFSDGKYYLGYLTPTVWHNSTTILLVPFAILLFFMSFDLVIQPKITLHQAALVGGVIILNATIKPSFLFCWVPGIAAFIVLFFRTAKNIGLMFYLGIIALGAIAAEYYLVYVLKHTSHVLFAHDDSHVVIAPLEVWHGFSPNIPAAACSSLLFPALYLALNFKRLLSEKIYVFALLQYAFAALVWVLLAESGVRLNDGNFYWQVVPAGFLLFLLSAIDFLREVGARQKPFSLRVGLLFGLYFVHVVFGLAYVVRILIAKDYL